MMSGLRRSAHALSVAAGIAFAAGWSVPGRAAESGVAILVVDTDRPMGTIDTNVYGHFLEHINHAVVDGLFAEQVRGQGFEGTDFATYWTTFGAANAVSLVDVPFENGTKSVRIAAADKPAGIRQGRVHLESGRNYSGSLWLRSGLTTQSQT